MQIGYNNDVEYRGKTFHIQTEDRGEEQGDIETQIFHAGAILDTSIISYKEMLADESDVDARIARIRQLMTANHRSLYKKLVSGQYDAMAGLEPLGDTEVSEVPSIEEFAPGQDRVPQAALQVEQGNVAALETPEPPGEAVDLSKLKARLAQSPQSPQSGQSAPARDAGSSDPTGMLSPEDIQAAMLADEERRSQQSAVPRPSRRSAEATGAPTAPPAGVVNPPARTSTVSPTIDFSSSGSRAWRGCEEPTEDLTLTALVEQFLAA